MNGPDGQAPVPEALASGGEGFQAAAGQAPPASVVAARLKRLKVLAFVLLGLMLAADLVSKSMLQESLQLREGHNG